VRIGAPIAQYRVATQTEEIDLARSATPTSISGNATVLVLGSRGYETAGNGKNEFICLVMRSWAADFADAEFWNPKLRAPICLNPAAGRSVLPGYLERTHWVLAGVSKSDMIARTKAALAAKTWLVPEPGAMGYMMSKRGFGATWGANLEGSPIIVAQSDPEPVTTFFIPVTHWSDGTPAISSSCRREWVKVSWVPFRLPDFEKFAAAFVLGVVEHTETHAKATADAWIGFRHQHGSRIWTPPLRDAFRRDKRIEDDLRPRFDETHEREAGHRPFFRASDSLLSA
jgi:hypothetical protein